MKRGGSANCVICALQGREMRRRGKVHRVRLHINKIDAVEPFISVRSYFIYVVGPSQEQKAWLISLQPTLSVYCLELKLRVDERSKKIKMKK